MTSIPVAEALHSFMPEDLSVRITAYDGSTAGREDATFGLDLRTERGGGDELARPDDRCGEDHARADAPERGRQRHGRRLHGIGREHVWVGAWLHGCRTR